MKFTLLTLLIFLTGFRVLGQYSYTPKVRVFTPEIMVGKNIPIYKEFPETAARTTLFLSYGTIHHDTTKHWVSYYNYPTTGLAISYSNLGNKDVFKNELSLYPYIILKTSRNPRKSWDFKIGLGGSYFNNPFDETTNPYNLVIGSKFTWAFKLFLYKNLIVTDLVQIKGGLGFLHHSNAHTGLPNYGLNSAMISLAAQFPTRKYDPEFPAKAKKMPIDKTKHFFLQGRYGIGFHELGGTEIPWGGPLFHIHSFSFSGGVIFKQQLKIRTGFTYRYYESFYDYVINNPQRNLGDDPRTLASNVNYFIGVEFLINHFSFDIEGGINLYKPFYEEYNTQWGYKEDFEYFRNKYITTRLGLNFYLFNTGKMPKHNIKTGIHVNANFGEADFMDISLGYTYLIK